MLHVFEIYMIFTFWGHSCFTLKTKGFTLLFDPFITGNSLASHIDIQSIKPDFILLSHAHGDHIADAEVIAKQSGSTIIANAEIVHYYKQNHNLEGHPMNSGGSWNFPFGKIIMTHAYHSSSFPDGSYGGNPNGFIISNEEGTVYYSGDTSLSYDMKLLGERYSISTAILPIGDNFTMDAVDAAKACTFLNAKQCISVHFDTFSYIKVHHSWVQKCFDEQSIPLILPKIGEYYAL